MTATDKPVPLSFAKGIDNRSMEADLRPGFFRDVVNLDIQGSDVAQRAGRTKWISGTDVHSLWGNDLIDFGLYVDGTTLNLLDPTGIVEPLVNGLQKRDMYYAYVAGRVYYSNGIDTGSITQNGVVRPWGIPTPTQTFDVAVTATGGMDPGTYMVTMTWFQDGEESGAPEPLVIEVPAGGGIALTNIPQYTNAQSARVYVSAPGDTRLFHNRDLPNGMTSVNIAAGNRGRPLDTLLHMPMGGCTRLHAAKGRIFAASGKLLRWTQPLRYGLTNRSTDYIKAPDAITAIGSPDVDSFVMYVGTAKKTYRLSGDDVNSVSLTAAAHVGVIPGSMVQVPGDALGLEGILYNMPVWLGTNGLFYAGSTSGIIPLNKKAVTNVYGKVAATYMERDSSRRYVAAGANGKTSGLAITDKMVARVVQLGP